MNYKMEYTPEDIKVLNNDPVYIFSDNPEAVPYILRFQAVLIKNGLGSQVVLTDKAYNLALGMRNCYPVNNYKTWTDLCLNRNKVVAIKFNAVPNYEPHELFELLEKQASYSDDFLEFFEC